jgi:hypothetical protein
VYASFNNEKEKQQVWCYYYKRKKKGKSRNLSNPHKSDDGKYQSETQMERLSNSLLQKVFEICNCSAV